MLSRVAENLYWLGRYMERAEASARIINVNANLLLDLPRGIAPGWAPLIAISGSQATYDEKYADYEERNVVRFLLSEKTYSGSITSTLHAARENARTIRDIIPREAWEVVNELHHYAAENASSGATKRGREAYLRRVIRSVQLFAGMMLSTMNHDEGYTFMAMGRLLERADMTTRILDVRSTSLLPDETADLRPFESVQWMSVLKSLSGYQMYRQRMHPRIRRTDVVRFLLLDEAFPRAVQRCTDILQTYLAALPNNDAPRRSLASAQRSVKRASINQLANEPQALHIYLDSLQVELAEVHSEIEAAWFLSGSANPA